MNGAEALYNSIQYAKYPKIHYFRNHPLTYLSNKICLKTNTINLIIREFRGSGK